MVYLKQAWLVILLALVYGAGLAGVQIGLSPRIEQNKKDETYRVIPDLVPGADARWIEETRVPFEGKEVLVYRANTQAGDPMGWVVPASGQGFADKIEILIGLDPEVHTITGVYVLNQKETPGLGDYITGIDFTSRFAGKSTGERLEAVRGGAVKDNQIDAITGATISSNAVTSIVNTAVETLGGALRERASGKGKSG
ncbi:MAG: FMN-binding protein [Candidatus Omnitrophica bacterium]|nr:FMN-binding protein [Candidatus Omnitrophota bacterium]